MKYYYRRAPIFLTIVFIIVIIGFSASYFGSFFEIESVYHFHAIPAILWVIILIIQPILYNSRKIKIHRIVGLASLLIAFLVFCGSLMIIDRMLKVSFEEMPINTPYQFAFSSINLAIGFLVYVVLAYYNRRNIHLHSRYMISTVFFALVPGLIRVFGNMYPLTLDQVTTLTYSTSIIAIFIMILYDHKTGKVYLPYLILLMWFSLIPILFTSIHEWNWWKNLVDAYRLS